MSDQTLEVSDLVAGYGGLDILRGVSLAVAPGELIVIIGPNGSGKSTLLKAIFGLVRARSGTVRFGSRDITGNPPERNVALGLSFAPQTDNVFPNLTIQENLEMGAYLKPRLLADRLAYVYELFPVLSERRRSAAGQLSGGQRQMLAIGRALMIAPSLLLLDEPSAGLSPKNAGILFERVQAISRSGMAILLVEQNARTALKLCHRAYVLATGRNQLQGTGEQLLNNPEIGRLYLGG